MSRNMGIGVGMKVFVYSKKGSKKDICEDSAIVDGHIISDSYSDEQIDSDYIIAIADGVGGNAGGDMASRYVLTELKDIKLEDISEEKISQYIKAIHKDLLDYAAEIPEKKTMATTLSGIIGIHDTCYIFHVGNTRIYGLQGNYLKQYTKDQTTYQWLLSRGQIEEADRFNKNEITNCIGGGNLKYADSLYAKKCVALDRCKRILLSSDGIHEYVSIDDLEDFILGEISEETMKVLVNKAEENGSNDDKTVIVIDRM